MDVVSMGDSPPSTQPNVWQSRHLLSPSPDSAHPMNPLLGDVPLHGDDPPRGWDPSLLILATDQRPTPVIARVSSQPVATLSPPFTQSTENARFMHICMVHLSSNSLKSKDNHCNVLASWLICQANFFPLKTYLKLSGRFCGHRSVAENLTKC